MEAGGEGGGFRGEDAAASGSGAHGSVNRIRVTLTFDLSLDEPGFPDWLHEVVPAGINDLIDDGKARPCGYIGRRYQFTKLTEPKAKRPRKSGAP